jgi:hypothetical protein
VPAELGLPTGAGDAGWPGGAPTGRHPGWPARLGPIAVGAGLVELRPPRLFDSSAWSRIRLRDRLHLENWEPTGPGRWEERNASMSWPSQWWALRSLARHGQSLPFVITVDGELAGQITVGNVVRGALCSAWIGYWVASHLVRGGVATAAVAMLVDHCFADAGCTGWRRPSGRRTRRACGCSASSASSRRGCSGVIWTWPATGGTTCASR